jgi:uncharacterized protein YjbJ (UPF0337 family)
VFGRRNVKTRQDLVRAEFGESWNLFRQAAVRAAGGLGASVGPSLGMAKDTAMNKTNSARGKVKPAAGKVTNAASSSWDSTLAAFAPLADAAKQGSAHARKLDSKKKDKKDDKGTKVLSITTTTTTEEMTSRTGLYALLATGVVVGAAGALVARRRTRAKWAEYEPGSLHSDASSFIDAGATSTKSYVDKGAEATTDMIDDSAGRATKATNLIKDHAKSAVETVRTKIHSATAGRGSDLDEKVADTVDTAADKASGMADKAAEKVNEGTSRMSDKADAKHNVGTPSGGSPTNTSAASSRGNRMDDEVDDLLRSAKNGRM